MAAPRSYLDVNVFVYWLGAHPVFGGKAKSWIERAEGSPRGSYVTSSLTVYELLVVLAGLTDRSLADREFVGEVIGAATSLPGLSVIPLAEEDHVEAVELMDEYGLDYEDALHLSVALKAGAKVIVSNDRDFDKAPVVKRVF